MTKMISTAFKYFFDGFDQYVVFTTKKQCKEYLKSNPNINRIKDLKEIGIEEWKKISEHPRHKVFEIIDNVAVPMEIDVVDPVHDVVDPLHSEYCEPNCSFCESDKAHYQQMSEFFDEMLEHLNFHTFVARCSRCAEASAPYVGIISGKTVFAFCVDCRDELTLKKNAAIAAQERISA